MTERKKSWREIDAGRDKSAHRRVEKPGTTPYEKRTNKSYKAELDRFFDHGVASTRIKGLMNQAGTAPAAGEAENPERVKLLRKIRQAATFDSFVEAVNTLRRDHGIPRDVDVLSRMLEHPDEEAIQEALAALLEIAPRFNMMQVKALKSRLTALETASQNPQTLEQVAQLKAKL
jgi:hypothetical protein